MATKYIYNGCIKPCVINVSTGDFHPDAFILSTVRHEQYFITWKLLDNSKNTEQQDQADSAEPHSLS